MSNQVDEVKKNNEVPFYFCRDQKKVVNDLEKVKDTYFLIDDKCQISESKDGEKTMVKTIKDADIFAKHMGWVRPVWEKK
jgi:hypothetical protein